MFFARVAEDVHFLLQVTREEAADEAAAGRCKCLLRGPKPELFATFECCVQALLSSRSGFVEVQRHLGGGEPYYGDWGGVSLEATQVIPTPSHLLDRIWPISSPKIPVFCAFSPPRRDGSNEPKTGIQGQETVSRAPKHRFAGLANSGCSERMAGARAPGMEPDDLPERAGGDARVAQQGDCDGLEGDGRRADARRTDPGGDEPPGDPSSPFLVHTF